MTATTEQRSLADLFPALAAPREADVPLDRIERGMALRPSATLRASLEGRGLLQPVILNALLDGRYRVIDGRRRIAAADALGWGDIRALVYAVDDLAEASMAVTANAVRGDNPLTDLAAILRLHEAGFSEGQIAAATGLSRALIRKRLKLALLPDGLLEGLFAGKIAVGVAERAASLPPARQEELAATFTEAGRLTGEDVAAASRASTARAVAALDPALFAPPPPRPLQETLGAALRDLLAAHGGITLTDWLEACNGAWIAHGEEGVRHG